MNEFGANFFANKNMSNMSKRDKLMNIYIENIHLHKKHILTIFYHECMGEGVVLAGKSEQGIESIRHLITSGVMEIKIIQLILKLECKEMIIVF